MIISKKDCLLNYTKKEKKEKITMKKKTIAKTGATMLTMAMLLNGTTVFAAGKNYTGVAGTTTTFDKYLVMDTQANIPNASFSYSITPGTPKSYNVGENKFEILAGIGTPTMAGVDSSTANTIAFKQSDTITATGTAASGDQVKNLESTQKYVKKIATLDFSGITFTEPGVYRYVITETGDNLGITNDANTKRILDVYVIDNAGELEIASYVLHATESDLKMGDDSGTVEIEASEMKSQGFTNVYDTSDLTFKKEVAGNQASRDKYFKFTVNITGAVAGTVYDVDVTGADEKSKTNAATIAENEEKNNVKTMKVGDDGTISQDFYLQHGQQIKIQGIAKNTKYEVTENKEDYKSEAAVVTGYTDAASGTIASTDLKTSYKNTRSGVIPTGVIMTVAPFAAVTLLGAVGMVTIKMRKKEDDEE